MSKPLDFSTWLAMPDLSVKIKTSQEGCEPSVFLCYLLEEKNGRWNNKIHKNRGSAFHSNFKFCFKKETHTNIHMCASKLSKYTWKLEQRKQSTQGYSGGPRICCNYFVIFSCAHETILSAIMYLFKWAYWGIHTSLAFFTKENSDQILKTNK